MRGLWPNLLSSLGLFASIGFAQESVDPRENFLSAVPRNPSCLWSVEADLNGDRLADSLLTLASYRNGRAGHIWRVYLRTKEGYVVLDELISFRTDAVFVGDIVELDASGLFTYFPGGNSQGALVAFQIVGNQIVQTTLKVLRPAGSDAAMYKKYFETQTISVKREPIFDGKCSEF